MMIVASGSPLALIAARTALVYLQAGRSTLCRLTEQALVRKV